MRQTAFFALLLCLVIPGCAAAAAVGAGIVISQDVLDNETFVAQLNEDVDVTWSTAKASLAKQSSAPIEMDDDLRVANGKVDNAEVIVNVEAFDLNRCRLSVSATKFGINNGEIAEMVFNRILKRLQN
jgi:hypothetical protein